MTDTCTRVEVDPDQLEQWKKDNDGRIESIERLRDSYITSLTETCNDPRMFQRQPSDGIHAIRQRKR